ncbi:MAG: hypothetical protein SP1CHLAM9_10580 [Chlamydiia bacterium]|nr:hypothetical protein [Chlamydiia bacterium]
MFVDKRSGEIIRADAGDSGKLRHKGHDHFHILNPKATGSHNMYIDGDGNPIAKGRARSHVYSEHCKWWEKVIDITRYQDFFHDGTILKIEHFDNGFVFLLKSAEMDSEDIIDNWSLSKDVLYKKNFM